MRLVETEPPSGYRCRPARTGEEAAVGELLAVADAWFAAPPSGTVEDIARDWARPRFDLEEDTWVVTTSQDELAAYAEVWDAGAYLESWGVVHPAHWGHGIGSYLREAVEERASAYLLWSGERHLRLFAATLATDTGARDLFTGAGYSFVRRFWHMRADLDEKVDVPPPPKGIRVREFAPETDARSVHSTLEDCLANHWEHTPQSFDEWWSSEAGDLDPGLWLVAEDGDNIVGVLTGRERAGDGWVDDLGVRTAWRRAGLGKHLLLTSFGEFFRRGFGRVGLNVDSDSTTDAPRLYESAGMRMVSGFDFYEKVIGASETRD